MDRILAARWPMRSDAPRVERVAKAVADEIERKHQQEYRETWPYRHPRGVVDVVLRRVEHAAPARRWRLLSKSEKRQACFGDHGRRDGERPLEHQRRDDVRQHMAQ